MQRLLTMPFAITAVAFDRSGHIIPKRLDCAGRSFRLQAAARGQMYGFLHAGRYYWIERSGRSWHWVHYRGKS